VYSRAESTIFFANSIYVKSGGQECPPYIR
jgi:hypothetical protein